jgi:predicted transcriptional regulator
MTNRSVNYFQSLLSGFCFYNLAVAHEQKNYLFLPPPIPVIGILPPASGYIWRSKSLFRATEQASLHYFLIIILGSQTLYPKHSENRTGACPMSKSKLEICESILNVLSAEASSIDRLSYETDLDCNTVKDNLRFLVKNGLVEERGLGSVTLHVLTEKGQGVLRALNFQKYVAKVRKTISTLDEAM